MTSGMHLSRRTYVLLFLQTMKNIYFSPTGPLLVLSTPEKHYKFFGFTKTVLDDIRNLFRLVVLKCVFMFKSNSLVNPKNLQCFSGVGKTRRGLVGLKEYIL